MREPYALDREPVVDQVAADAYDVGEGEFVGVASEAERFADDTFLYHAVSRVILHRDDQEAVDERDEAHELFHGIAYGPSAAKDELEQPVVAAGNRLGEVQAEKRIPQPNGGLVAKSAERGERDREVRWIDVGRDSVLAEQVARVACA